jgi:A/G-specific adenine glycosylase
MRWWEPDMHQFPWRFAEHDEWKLLVTEILLQRTRAGAVADLFDEFFERFPTPKAMATASVGELEDAIYSLGLRHRAERLGRLGNCLVRFEGSVPRTKETLRELPGVGPYVAGAFLTLHRNEHVAFADANVVRVLGRFLGFEWDRETYRRKWFIELTNRFFLNRFEPSDFGYAVLDFAREVCARPPRHDKCPREVREKCQCFRLLSDRAVGRE